MSKTTIDLGEALERIADILDLEEVQQALGLTEDSIGDFTSTVGDDGQIRDYTEADLAADLAQHNALIFALRSVAPLERGSMVEAPLVVGPRFWVLDAVEGKVLVATDSEMYARHILGLNETTILHDRYEES